MSPMPKLELSAFRQNLKKSEKAYFMFQRNKQNKPKRTININKAGTESNPENANKPAPTAKPNKPKPRNNRPKKNNTDKKDIKPKE